MRGYNERACVIDGSALTVNGQASFSKEFPMGEGWFAMYLTIYLAFTVGTGTTPIAEGELNIVKNVLLRTDRGEILCNLPGRAIWKIAALKNGALPYKDAIAAATATYAVHLPIYFCDPEGGHSMLRPEDTIVDTSRYNSVSLAITLGGVADLLSTVGTSSLTATMDVEIERTFGRLPGTKAGEGGKPVAHINYDFRPPVDANSTQNIEIEKSSDMSLKRIYLHTGASGVAGVPWSGTNSDTRLDVLQIKDQNRFIEKDRNFNNVQYQNKLESGLESVLTGVVCFNFVKDRAITSALATADKSVLQMTFTQETAAALNICTLTQEAIRSLK